jgi:hypothetical protein
MAFSDFDYCLEHILIFKNEYAVSAVANHNAIFDAVVDVEFGVTLKGKLCYAIQSFPY